MPAELRELTICRRTQDDLNFRANKTTPTVSIGVCVCVCVCVCLCGSGHLCQHSIVRHLQCVFVEQ